MILTALLALGGGRATAESITLAWDPSPDLSVVGYRIYTRALPGTNYTTVDVGNTNVFTLHALSTAATYSFYVTCYNAAGLESDPSNSVEYTLPLPPV